MRQIDMDNLIKFKVRDQIKTECLHEIKRHLIGSFGPMAEYSKIYQMIGKALEEASEVT